MKNVEEKFDYAKYYTELLAMVLGGEKSTVFGISDLYKNIDLVDEKYEIKSANSNSRSARRWLMAKNFLTYFKEYVTEEIPDDSYKGKGKRFIYSISIKPERFVGLEERLRAKFPGTNYSVLNVKKDKEDVKIPVSFLPKTKVKEEKPKSIIPGKRLPRKEWLKRFYNLLCLAVKSSGKVSKKQIKVVMDYTDSVVAAPSKLIKDWKSTLIRGGFVGKFHIKKTADGQSIVEIENAKDLVYQIAENYKKWFGEEVGIGASEVLHTTSSVKLEERETIKPMKSGYGLTFEKAYAIFVMASLIKRDNRFIEFFNMTSSLNKSFRIDLGKQEIIDLIKEQGKCYFEVNLSGGNPGINLKKDIDWDDFISEFHPKNFKYRFLARIGMTKEEISRFIPEDNIKVMSEISECDAVYEITNDHSMHSFKNLCNLYRTFRGKDKIFSESLEKKIKNEIILVDGKSYEGNLAFDLEC